MPPVRRRRVNDVERRVHFFRADCGADESGAPIPLSPAAALTHIDGLDFASFADDGGRYYEDGENVYCLWVDSNTRVRFAVIRREALPAIEDEGVVEALDLSDTAGLVEQIHVRFFPDNIVGFDFNFYGPRLPRLGAYLNRVAQDYGEPVVFEPLLRRDVVADLSDEKEIRLLALRIRRSHIESVAQADEDLGSAFEALAELSDASELEIIARPKPYSGNAIGGIELVRTIRRLASREDIRDVASEFRIKAASPGEGVANLDLLGDSFIFDTRILRQNPKGRALDPHDAFSKIETAYRERREDLERAAALAVG